jgi:hypothetical protein
MQCRDNPAVNALISRLLTSDISNLSEMTMDLTETRILKYGGPIRNGMCDPIRGEL